MAAEPGKITIRMYNVGFGDCFLVTFHYAPPRQDQHILIDFGSAAGGDLKKLAARLHKDCGGKLYAVVATHRHRDHINGFSDAGGKGSPGAIIASCKPEVVIQPWTEDPAAAADAKAPPGGSAMARDPRHLFFASMNAMQDYARAVAEVAGTASGVGSRQAGLARLASINTSNPDAVRNLRTMGKRPPRFLQYGSPSGLEDSELLPGVKVRVLGPPSLEQQNLKKYASKSEDYWLASRFWGLEERAARAGAGGALFPRDARFGRGPKPLANRWFLAHADAALKKNTLEIVTILDQFLNNTSLILLFEAGGKKLLFPGDAQLENWRWALSQEGTGALLKDVDVYKVGHHGSRNATPKALWNLLDKRRDGTLTTLLSTASGVYGRSEAAKVPSANLVEALKKESRLENTQDLKGGQEPIVVELA